MDDEEESEEVERHQKNKRKHEVEGESDVEVASVSKRKLEHDAEVQNLKKKLAKYKSKLVSSLERVNKLEEEKAGREKALGLAEGKVEILQQQVEMLTKMIPALNSSK